MAIDWIIRRIGGEADSVETAVGLLPVIDQLNLDGVDLSDDDVQELFRVDAESWRAEANRAVLRAVRRSRAQ